MEPFTMDDLVEDMTNPSFGNLDESSSGQDVSMSFVGGSDSLEVTGHFKPSTRVSLLVESLVKSLVTVYERDLEKSARVYQKICEELFQVGLIDESWNMNELEGVRVEFQRALFGLLSPPLLDPPSPAASLLMRNTYYQGKFDELENIGGGAFGKVLRVRNRLDAREYAMKKVSVQFERLSSIKNYLSEVKILSSLNHPNIVEYKDTWLELVTSEKVNNNGSNRLTNVSTTIGANSELISDLTEDETEPSLFHKEAIPNNNNTESESNSEIVFEHTNSEESPIIGSRIASQTIPQKTRRPWATLFIQMALCHGTLDHWLSGSDDALAKAALIPSNGPVLTTEVVQKILIQILRGLNHIHSKGGVHHDIKPSNILFVSANPGSLLVQIGDFGLACLSQGTFHRFSRGTPLYAAQEQLLGLCDSKSDMYSVGIVLFELLEGPATAMDRSERILELRSRHNPPVSDLTEMNLNNLVSALIRTEPSERPDASSLLKALEGAKVASVPDFETMRSTLEAKEKEIETLKELLKTCGTNQ